MLPVRSLCNTSSPQASTSSNNNDIGMIQSRQARGSFEGEISAVRNASPLERFFHCIFGKCLGQNQENRVDIQENRVDINDMEPFSTENASHSTFESEASMPDDLLKVGVRKEASQPMELNEASHIAENARIFFRKAFPNYQDTQDKIAIYVNPEENKDTGKCEHAIVIQSGYSIISSFSSKNIENLGIFLN